MMKQKNVWAAIALMMAAMAMGCGKSEEETPQPVIDPVEETNPTEKTEATDDLALTRAERQMVAGSNDFAFNLLRQIRKSKGDKSIVVSPLSIVYALGMVNNGATGDTRQQICEALGFGLPSLSAPEASDSINAFCRKMLTLAPTRDPKTKVMIANTIYVNKDYTLKPVFVQKARDYYDAEPETRDFADGKTMDVINRWASDHTEKMIEKVLDESTFDPAAVSYLLNAVYFKGTWTYKFDKAETSNEPFEGISGTVPMMHQQFRCRYAEGDEYQAVQLLYGNGAYTMTILLPREGKTLSHLLTALTGDSWQKTYFHFTLVDLKLPRFETNTNLGLADVMSGLGMPDAFIPAKAQFPDFCNVPTYIGMMMQTARIRLDEEGTEAAAVTTIGVGDSAVIDEPAPISFHAVRPFLYVISEQSTGAIFFIGQYAGK